MVDIYRIYRELFNAYGPQGWWPFVYHCGTNPTKTGSIKGYHPGDYSYPHTRDEQFEVCLGCFLTQNTAWTNVERSLLRLRDINALTPEKIMRMDEDIFIEAIKPSGYKNQKAKYIKNFIPFFLSLNAAIPKREELLLCSGIGPETADSMLLYAFKQPEFIVDTYTKRIFEHLRIVDHNATYDDIKRRCEDAMRSERKTIEELVQDHQEFHALLVEHAKRYYSKKPYGQECFLCSL